MAKHWLYACAGTHQLYETSVGSTRIQLTGTNLLAWPSTGSTRSYHRNQLAKQWLYACSGTHPVHQSNVGSTLPPEPTCTGMHDQTLALREVAYAAYKLKINSLYATGTNLLA